MPSKDCLQTLLAMLYDPRMHHEKFGFTSRSELCLILTDYVGQTISRTPVKLPFTPLPDHFIVSHESSGGSIRPVTYSDTRFLERLFSREFLSRELNLDESISLVVSPKSNDWKVLDNYINNWLELIGPAVEPTANFAGESDFRKRSSDVLKTVRQIYGLDDFPHFLDRRLET